MMFSFQKVQSLFTECVHGKLYFMEVYRVLKCRPDTLVKKNENTVCLRQRRILLLPVQQCVTYAHIDHNVIVKLLYQIQSVSCIELYPDELCFCKRII